MPFVFILFSLFNLYRPALGEPWEKAHARPIEGMLLVSLGSKRMRRLRGTLEKLTCVFAGSLQRGQEHGALWVGAVARRQHV